VSGWPKDINAKSRRKSLIRRADHGEKKEKSQQDLVLQIHRRGLWKGEKYDGQKNDFSSSGAKGTEKKT